MVFQDGDLVKVVSVGGASPQNSGLVGKEGKIAGEVKLSSGDSSYLVMFDDAGMESVKAEFLQSI